VTFSFERHAASAAKPKKKPKAEKRSCYHCSRLTARIQELFSGRKVHLCGRCWAVNFSDQQKNRIISAIEAREKIALRSREHAHSGNHGLQNVRGTRARVVSGGLPSLGKRR